MPETRGWEAGDGEQLPVPVGCVCGEEGGHTEPARYLCGCPWAFLITRCPESGKKIPAGPPCRR